MADTGSTKHPPTRVSCLAVIGLGLIGSSLARALRARGQVDEIRGCGRDPARLEAARQAGIVDRVFPDPAAAVAGADVVVVATPLGAMAGQLARIAEALGHDAVVTDVGSAKSEVLEQARHALPAEAFARFVPGHPVAGNERSGWEAGNGDLFQGRRVVLTPDPAASAEAVAKIRDMWIAAGAEVTEMEPGRHDRVLAATSHLPHLLAYTLLDLLAARPEQEDVYRFAAGGLADFSRIAGSDPRMWADICAANRQPLVAVLDEFLQQLRSVREAVDRGADDELMAVFQRARETRERFLQEWRDSADES